MNFASAITSLRDGRCAKTPSMRGYVSRADVAAPADIPSGASLAVKSVDLAQSAIGSALSAGDLVYASGGTTSQNGFFRASRAYLATESFDSPPSDRVQLFDLAFVENPGYNDADGDSTGSAANPYVFFAEMDYNRKATVHTEPSAALEVDRELLGLLCSTDWEVFDTSAAADASVSAARW